MLAGLVLPQDIIREIVDLLSPADILNFSLTVRNVFLFFSPYFSSLPLVTHTPCFPHSLPTFVPSSFQPYTTQLSSNQVNIVAELF